MENISGIMLAIPPINIKLTIKQHIQNTKPKTREKLMNRMALLSERESSEVIPVLNKCFK